jgi:hypothetical protein
VYEGDATDKEQGEEVSWRFQGGCEGVQSDNWIQPADAPLGLLGLFSRFVTLL